MQHKSLLLFMTIFGVAAIVMICLIMLDTKSEAPKSVIEIPQIVEEELPQKPAYKFTTAKGSLSMGTQEEAREPIKPRNSYEGAVILPPTADRLLKKAKDNIKRYRTSAEMASDLSLDGDKDQKFMELHEKSKIEDDFDQRELEEDIIKAESSVQMLNSMNKALSNR